MMMEKTSLEMESDLGGAPAASTVRAMAERIRAARGALVTSHINPDGDAIGSEIALFLGLRKLGKKALVVNDHPAPEKYRFLDPGGAIEVLSAEPAAGAFADLDLGILLDTSEPSRAGRLEKAFFDPRRERICLDHHPGPPNPLFLHHWVAERASATGVMVLRLLDALGVPLDLPIATALMVAIATDTGWFRFSNTTPSTLRDAARLVEAGVAPEPLHARIYEESTPRRLVLLGRLLAGIHTEMGGRFVWSLLDRATLDASGVPFEEMDGFSEELKAASGAEVVAAVVEVAPRAWKVSLRARGQVAVNAIAAGFSGGGHRKAAGFRMEGDRESVLERLRRSVEKALSG